MGAYLRNNIWQISWPNPNRPGHPFRESTGMTNEEAWDKEKKVYITKAEIKRKAVAMAKKKEVEQAEGKNLDIKKKSKITYYSFIDIFITQHSKAEQNRTWEEDERILYNFLRMGVKTKTGSDSMLFHKDILLDEISKDHIGIHQSMRLQKHFFKQDDCSYKIQRIVTNDTINRDMNVLSSLLSYAEEKGLVDKNVLYKRKKLIDNPRRERNLTDAELNWVSINAPKVSPDLYDVVMTWVNTGFRKGEVESLEWIFIDFDNNTILLIATNNKSKRRRLQPMNQMLKEILLKRKLHADPLDKFVFPAKFVKDKGLDFRCQFRKLQKLAKEAKIAHFTPHDLRRTFATKALKLTNGNLSAVQRLLGHASSKTTEQSYAKTATSDLIDVVNMLGTHNSTKITQPNILTEKEQFNKIVSSIDKAS